LKHPIIVLFAIKALTHFSRGRIYTTFPAISMKCGTKKPPFALFANLLTGKDSIGFTLKGKQIS
ncbi:hypothetical protein, partial [Bacillus mobilis]|uniref:hypothetical protein n=1 Tax=Bacillus mobilis TaxID=2026190 RepID=UPI003CF03961